jgi:hypothetical protein
MLGRGIATGSVLACAVAFGIVLASALPAQIVERLLPGFFFSTRLSFSLDILEIFGLKICLFALCAY